MTTLTSIREPLMAVAEPALVVDVDGDDARVTSDRGVEDVSLRPITATGDIVVEGDWVVVARGVAVARLDDDDARVLLNQPRLTQRAA